MEGLIDKNESDHLIKSKKRFNKRSIVPYLFISPWILGFLIFTSGPILFSLVISFFDWPIAGIPKFVGFRNYINMFTNDPMFWNSLGVTIKFALILVPLNISVALLLAILLNQKVKGLSIYRTIFYLPTVISGAALAMIWSWVFDGNYGILNYILSLFSIQGPNWLQNPDTAIFVLVFAGLWGQGALMLIFLAGLKDIPSEVYEAAKIDGASSIRQFLYVTLPLLSPTILFNVITSIIAAFQQLTLALTITQGGPLNSTHFYAMYTFENAFKYFKMGYSAANSWFMFTIILVLTAIVFKSSSVWVFYENEGNSNLKKKVKNIG